MDLKNYFYHLLTKLIKTYFQSNYLNIAVHSDKQLFHLGCKKEKDFTSGGVKFYYILPFTIIIGTEMENILHSVGQN